MTAAGVIGDWREPDILRLAPTPLYNSFADAWRAAEVVGGIVPP
jgi:kynureninase